MNAYVSFSLSLSRIYSFESIRILFRIHMKSVHLALILIPVSKSANSTSNILMCILDARACLCDIQIYWHLRARYPRVSRRSRSFTRLVRGPVSFRVWSHEVLPISSARDPLSRATCDINPASVSSLSQTECPRTWGTAIYTSVQYSHRAFVA